MLYAVNKKSVLKEAREKIEATTGNVELTQMQARALYALAAGYTGELVQFDPGAPLVRKRKSRAKEDQAEKLPIEDEGEDEKE